ncbi:MAG: serine acetyltransferase [Saprospiraceae bacterium]|nr:serine acetyltransferase [Saprospiraceae bacterium]
MTDIIKHDLYRYRPYPYSQRQLLMGFRSQGFRYTYFLRKYCAANNLLTRIFFKFFLLRYRYRYGFQISSNAVIGPGLYIGHFGTVIVSAGAVIGKNCNLSPGVTIGRDHRGKRRGAPTIGDSVWIGTNAVLVGKIEIGSDILIAPNSFVNFDIPDHSIVIGNPGKIIPKSDATSGYVNNRIS